MTLTIYRGLPAQPPAQTAFLTIGNFDGVHLGHQALLTDMLASAHRAGCLAGVLTFDPHPLAVLRPQVPLHYLTTIDERIALLAAHGLDFVVVLPFTHEVAAMSARDFTAALRTQLGLQELWVGPDFALGRGREGTPDRLAEFGRELGYQVHVIGAYEVLGQPVHSSRIRALLSEHGAAREAASLLGRPYQVWGEVSRGAGRGHTLGYPTANLAVPANRLTPAFGIYACWAWLGEEAAEGRPTAVSIGVRPTFDSGAPSVEAYLLDYSGDLYGQRLGLSFVERLRPEQRFPSIDALIAQMDRDVAATRELLTAPPRFATPPAWEELPHMADWAIRVRGANQRELFECAALAMFSLQNANISRPVSVARSIQVEGGNSGELLVAWLNRLLLLQQVQREMYTRFDIQDRSERGLRAVVYGYPGSPNHTEVKAVTFWGLSVIASAAGWTATITFDV